MNQVLLKILFLIIFSVAYFGLRLPIATEPLIHEEGIFAELMVHRPVGPKYGLSGRMDGVNIYGTLSHPAGCYELLRMGGWLAKPILQDPVNLDDTAVTPRLRLLSCGYQFCFWIIIALGLCCRTKSVWPYLVLLIAALSPLSIKTSALLQIDNTSGVLICGLAAMLLYLADQVRSSLGLQRGLCVIAGFAVGLGKQEWSFILLIAAAIGCLAAKYSNPDRLLRESLIQGLSIAAGVLFANSISCIYDPTNYLSSFQVIGQYSALSAGDTPNLFFNWISMQRYWLPFLVICFALLGFAMVNIRQSVRKTYLNQVLFFYALLLLLSYYLFSRNSDIRYFAPSLAVSSVACIASIPRLLSFRQKQIVTAMAVLSLVSTLVFLCYYTPNTNIQLREIQQGRIPLSADTVLYLNSGAGWNKPNINYMNDTLDYETVRKHAAALGKTVVRPNP